jgi:UDP-N-acetylmuramate--alanine ligase
MGYDKIIAGAKLHFIGLGGIGMSGLAKMFADNGCIVSGSDRGWGNPENDRILRPLAGCGIKIFLQDGSFINNVKPDYLVYSTAIEDDNPDFVAAPDIPRLHRSEALTAAMLNFASGGLVAVAGTCGKTTVTSWLAETLYLADESPSFLTGGLVNRFIQESPPGNFRHGPGAFVFEADESDKSLLNYSPDLALVLNLGADHYSREELVAVFRQFLRQTTRAAVVSDEVLAELGPECMAHLEINTFSLNADSPADWRLTGYASANGHTAIEVNNQYKIKLPLPGKHNAANALAILAAGNLLGVKAENLLKPIADFQGVWRRTDYHGEMPSGAVVYDDYAHNPEKIASCINAIRETVSGRVIALFQPHGFGPLGFMREELFTAVQASLDAQDIFALMPVFYAGGTSSFKPTSTEVAADYKSRGGAQYQDFTDRKAATEFLQENAGPNDVVLIMGARDNSLSDWAAELSQCSK